MSDVAPNITIEVISDTQVKLTNNNLAVGYAVDVYKNGVFEPDYSLSENDLLGLGLFGSLFGTKTKVITLPDSLPGDQFRFEMYAKVLPEGHPRREFSREVALKNMDAAFAGVISNIFGFLGIVAEAPKLAAFESDLIRASGACDQFRDGDIANGFNKLATWATSKASTTAIVTIAQEAGITISASTAATIGGIVAVILTLPTVCDVVFSDPDLYHSVTFMHIGNIAPTYDFYSYRCGVEPELCTKDLIPTFDIGDTWCFWYIVTNRSIDPLYNVSLEVSLYGPDETLVENSSSSSGFNVVWNYPPTYPEYWDLGPYSDPLCMGSVGLHQLCYPLAVSSIGHQYRGGLYRLESQLLGWYGSDTLGSSSQYIKILDGQVPETPQLVTGEVVGNNIVLSWRPPYNTYDISFYVVRRFNNPERTGQIRVSTVVVPDRETPSEKLIKVSPYLLDESIEPMVSYYYEIKTVDWNGLQSDWSQLYGPFIWKTGELPVGNIVSITAVPGPMPALQGRDNITFVGTGDDVDNSGSPPEIRCYRWITNLGKINGDTELYNGPNTSFSIPASDLRVGTHNISLTVQDNEGDWSDSVTSSLTIVENAPAQGHDVLVGLYVSESGTIQPPGNAIKGEIWVINNGNYTESGNMLVSLEKANGEILDSHTYPFNNLESSNSTNHISYSLESSYVGDAIVRAKVLVQLDEDWSNNEKSIPIFFSSNPNPTDSFDGFQRIEFAPGETIKYVYDREGQQHTIKIPTFDPPGYCIDLIIDGMWFHPCVGDYLLGLPSWAVIHLAYRYSGTYVFYFWWPDNNYKFSTQYLAVPFGGSGQFEISPTSGSWPDGIFDVDFIGGLLPAGWTRSVTPNGNKLVVEIRAPYSCGSARYDGWVHMHRKDSVGGVYGDAFSFMRLQAVYSPPETVINSGPDGTIYVRDVTFAWSGSDDTTETSQLQYAYKLSPVEPEFSPFANDTSKTYFDLEDGQYTFYVKARDLGECEDMNPESRSFTVFANHCPNIPGNILPIPGQQKVSLTPILITSQFSDSDKNDAFAKSRFQVRLDSQSYDYPVWDSGEISPGATTIQVTQRLIFLNKYWWRCQYQDNKGAWSSWSNETYFTTRGFVNLSDFATFANSWQNICSTPNWCEGSDLDRSGKVDIEDLAILAESWMDSFRPVIIPNFTEDGVVNFRDYAILVNYWLENNPILDIAPAGGDGIIDFRDLYTLCWYWLEGTTP